MDAIQAELIANQFMGSINNTFISVNTLLKTLNKYFVSQEKYDKVIIVFYTITNKLA